MNFWIKKKDLVKKKRSVSALQLQIKKEDSDWSDLGGEVSFTGDSWALKSVFLSGYMGQKVKIGFKLLTDDQQIVSIDNIKLYNEGASSVEENLQITTQLFQNYPNPFNPSTTIKFTNSKFGDVKLEVYNINGQFVKSLQNGKLKAGYYSYNFNGNNLPSGVYLYKLSTEGKILKRKMIMVK